MSVWFVNFGDCVVSLNQIQGIGETGSAGHPTAIYTAFVTYETKMTVPEAWTRLCEALRATKVQS